MKIYMARRHWVANPKRMIDEVDIAIANGTPLDDIKTELQKLAYDEWNQGTSDFGSGIEYAIKIIDKHIGKEQE